jgi:hypothetical protein
MAKTATTRWGPITNAAVTGYCAGEVADELEVLWKERAMLARTSLSECDEPSWRRARRTPLLMGRDYLSKYAFG